MAVPQAAQDHYQTMQRLQALAVAAGRRSWRRIDERYLSETWRRALADLSPVISAVQVRAAEAGASYGAFTLAEQGSYVAPEAFVNPAAFGGYAADGRSLDGLLYSPITTVKDFIGGGMGAVQALAQARGSLDTMLRTTIADAGRGASSVDVAARPKVGYVRMLNPPSCDKCVVLAGKFFRWNAGFRRHPRCDCVHVETTAGSLQGAKDEGLVSDPGLSAAVYTEITDVETEVNGWLTYDRIMKISASDVTTIRNAHNSLINSAGVTYSPIVPTSESTAQSWRYTTAAPASNWASTGFSDSAWSTGSGGFGTAGTPGAIVRTTWNTADIWMRRTFNPGSLTAAQIANLVLRLHHDENAEVYINGVQATTQSGYTSTYLYTPINTAALSAIVVNGNNVLAIHCHQTTGGQYIDAGISLKGAAGGSGVIFYQDINYGGAASGAKGLGDYATLPADVPNDWMSSLRVPAGWVVDAYADPNFGGAVCTYTADTSWVGSACNDVMSSFRIRSSAVGVIFYQDINYGGVASGMKAKGDYATLPADIPNDWMSSLRVPAGWIVDAYADGNFAGAVCTYTADTSWVGSGCNDVMSSFRIR